MAVTRGGVASCRPAEMQAFIGLIIATGITRLPRLAMYWEAGHPLTGTPGFSNVMSQDRFLQLLRYLHANDESLSNADNDKLYKVRDFTNRINRNFSNNYSMGCNISIDESLIPFKGRLGFKQFIPSKRAHICQSSDKQCSSVQHAVFSCELGLAIKTAAIHTIPKCSTGDEVRILNNDFL